MRRCELDEVLQTVLHGATTLLNTKHGLVSLVDERLKVFVRRGSAGAFACGNPILFPMNKGMLGQVYRSGEMLVVDDYNEWDEKLLTSQNRDMHYVAMVPLKVETKVIGAFAVAFSETGRTPTEEDLFLLRRIGEIASIAVDNALLHRSYLRELVARKQTEESVRRLAYHDPLTGLPNRTLLMEYLDKELTTVHANAAGGAVFFVDVDDLKTVNDNFGHSCCDKIISLIGADLADELGPDSLVARIGGDEFVAVLRGVSDRLTVERTVARLK